MDLRICLDRLARVALGFTALVAASGALAQSANRAGQWETKLGLMYNGSWDSGFASGSQADVGSEVGFNFGVSYNLTDRLSFGGSFEYDSPSYRATLVNSANPSQTYNIRGSLENVRFLGDATYTFAAWQGADAGRFTFFGSALLGWTWTDTNIATSPPQTGCWWDPWWGPICVQWQNTRTIDGFSYGLGAGGRFDFNPGFAMELSYRYVWTDYGQASGAPGQDGIKLTFNWKF